MIARKLSLRSFADSSEADMPYMMFETPPAVAVIKAMMNNLGRIVVEEEAQRAWTDIP